MPATDEPQIALGRAIQQLREARGMSQEELAERAAVDLGRLAEIESGQADSADWNTVARVSRAAGGSLAKTATLAEHFEDEEAKSQQEIQKKGGETNQ